MSHRLGHLAGLALALCLTVRPARSAPPEIRGVALAPHFEGTRTRAQLEAAIDEIQALGATHLQLVVQWGQANTTADRIAPYRYGTDDEEVRALAHYARARGLRLLLFPILHLEAVGPGAWRGTLAPGDRARWWADYRRFILHYARIAAEVGADWLSVGSELGQMEGDRARWVSLIGAARAVFPGRLVYSANWDHFGHVRFWDQLDAVGVNAYFPLTRTQDSSATQLRATWRAVRARLTSWHAALGKPLWITEAGYPSMESAARRPYHFAPDAPPDLAAQQRAWQALIATWDDGPPLGGLFIWIWSGEGGEADRGYTLRNKPAYGDVRAWFTGPAGTP